MLGGAVSLATASQGGQVAWIVPTYRNGRTLWRWAEKITYGLRKTGKANANKTERLIEFDNGGFLGIYSADNPDSIRGEAFHLVILDEAARISEEAWTDAIQPTLADFDGEAFLISTPKGIDWFYTEYVRGKDDMCDIASFHAPTEANPSPQIQKAFNLAKSRVPDRTFRQEWLAEFLEDGAYFQGIAEAAIVEQPDTPADHPGHHFVAGLDWAISQDYTVLTIACRECNRVVDWDRFNKIDFTYQRERVVNHLSRWGAIVLPERNSIGLPNIELIRDRVRVMSGIDGAPGFNTLPSTKPLLIQRLASGLEHDGFKIPKDYADEFRQYQIEILPSGHTRFSAPDGRHDDRVISAALAYWALTSYTALPEQPAHQSRWAEYGIEQTEQDSGSKWRRY